MPNNKTYPIKNKNSHKKTKKGGFWGSNKNTDPNAPPAKQKSEGFNKGSDYMNYMKGSLKASRSAMNMPLTLATINYKLNAIMVHLGVNYKYSNGYSARNYTINKVVGEASNEGRGELKPNAVRGKITGFQSAVYTKATESDAYGKMKKKMDDRKANQIANQTANQTANQNIKY